MKKVKKVPRLPPKYPKSLDQMLAKVLKMPPKHPRYQKLLSLRVTTKEEEEEEEEEEELQQ